MEATTIRASTVIRSMPTSETRTQASTTMPLSRIRSRTSISDALWTRRGSMLTAASQQIAQWTEVDVQITRLKSEQVRQLVHLLFERHQCESDALYLLIREAAAFHTSHRLAFEQLTDEFDQRQ